MHRTYQAGENPTKRQFFGLILVIFDLHLRNAAYDNQTRMNNLHAWSLRLHGFKKLLLERKDDDVTDDEVFEHLKKHWRVRIFSASPENEFLTSDNPSIWISCESRISRLRLAILPLTPNHVAVAFDCRQVKVVGEQTTAKDEELLTELQLRNAHHCVYTSTELVAKEQQSVARRLSSTPRVRGLSNETGMEVPMHRLESDAKFSFMRSPRKE